MNEDNGVKTETEEEKTEEISEEISENKPQKKIFTRGFIVFCSVLVAIFIASVLLNSFVFMHIQVDGPSMENTFFTGDLIVANKVKKATYGDVVIISGEKGNDLLIKRVIAKGGDELKFLSGKVYLKKAGETDFTELDEPYIKSQNSTFIYGEDPDEPFIVTVPVGEIFYMGDNRENSSDSRTARYSTCKEEQIEAVVSDFAISIKGITGFFGRLFARKTS